MALSEKLQELVKKEAAILWPAIKIPPFDITEPPNIEFGDLSTALPLTLAKIINNNPLDIAKQFKKSLDKQKIEYIREITVTQPGYVNFHINFADLSQHLFKKILLQKENLGIDKKNKGNAIVEHTSINPNKAAHVGHLRNACLGDSVANILRTTGWEIEVQNYIDDTGVQLADVIVALNNFKDKQGKRSFDYFCWDIYTKIQKIYEIDEKLKVQQEETLKLIEAGDNKIATQAIEVANKIINAHLATMSRLGITYDLLVWEKDIIDTGLWPAVFEDLKNKKLITQPTKGEHKGAWVVEFGNNEREDKIMVKSNGIATYTAKDLAYQMWKFGLLNIDFKYYQRVLQKNKKLLLTTPAGVALQKRKKTAKRIPGKPNKVINIIDLRQSYPQKVIQDTLQKLGFDKQADNYIHLKYEVVKLSLAAIKELGIKPEQDKESYAMSGREGIGVKIDDLMNKIEIKIKKINPELSSDDITNLASTTIRYYILRNRPEREVVFDFEEALRTNGNTGIYLQYAYVRCNNILKKVSDWDQNSRLRDISESNISLESKAVIKMLENYPTILRNCAEELDPSLLTDFAFKLANNFSSFYETNPVLKAQSEKDKIFRLHIVFSTKQILENVLKILGIKPLEQI